jgi:hypothetical protein
MRYLIPVILITACADTQPAEEVVDSEVAFAPCDPATPIARAIVNAIDGTYFKQRGFTTLFHDEPGRWILGLQEPQPPFGVIIQATANDDGNGLVTAGLSPEMSPSWQIEAHTLAIDDGSPANAYRSDMHFSISVYRVCP